MQSLCHRDTNAHPTIVRGHGPKTDGSRAVFVILSILKGPISRPNSYRAGLKDRSFQESYEHGAFQQLGVHKTNTPQAGELPKIGIRNPRGTGNIQEAR